MSSAQRLVLSLFPGLGFLDSDFEAAGFCVVRGPDVLWGGDVRRFSPPPGVFDGVCGGPPCQTFSALANLVRAQGREPKFGNLIPEFERCVAEAQPRWFVMENVPAAPEPVVDGYQVHSQIVNNRWLGAEQNRVRRISFGTRDGRRLNIELAALEPALTVQAVLAGNRSVPVRIGGSGKVKATAPAAVTAAHAGGRNTGFITRYSLADALELQGRPRDLLDHAPFTAQGKLQAVANGVPRWMGEAIAAAVLRAMYGDER